MTGCSWSRCRGAARHKNFSFRRICGIITLETLVIQTYSAAGLASGLSEAVIVNPFEAVKVRMQSDRAHHSEAPSTSSVFRQISREEGLFNGVLRKGLTATMARNGAFNMIYFGFYHSVKDFVPQLSVLNEMFLHGVDETH